MKIYGLEFYECAMNAYFDENIFYNWNKDLRFFYWSEKSDFYNYKIDAKSLINQLKEKGELDKLTNEYCVSILNDKIPLTIGGGIGQSRLCMYMLQKAHIGEVQVSIWPKTQVEKLKENNIELL